MKKKVFFKWLLATILLQVPILNISAYDFISNGVFYLITSSSEKTVSVTYGPSSNGTYSGSLNIPSSVTNGGVTYSVTGITASACYNCTELTSLSIPQSLTTIGDNAFYNCNNLQNVDVPNIETWCNLKGLGKYASNPLYYAKQLNVDGKLAKDITLPKMSIIPDGLFWNCSSIENVIITDGPISIGISFVGSSIQSISIPSSVKSIDKDAFSGCSGLNKVRIEDGESDLNLGSCTEDYYDDIFGYWCGSNYYGLWHDCKIENLYIGRNIVYKYDPLLDNYNTTPKTYLKTLEFGESVKEISIIEGCVNLTTVIIPSSINIQSIPYNLFKNCSLLEEINIPTSVKTIGSYAFSGCASLKTIRLGDYVTTIDSKAFENCTNLEDVEIGESINQIYSSVFAGCKALKNLTVKASIPPTCGTDVFSTSIYSKCNLNVPQNYYARYFNAAPWWNFNNIKTFTEATNELLLSESNIEMTVGESHLLTVKFSDENVNEYNFTWNTSNALVVKFESEGVLKAVGEGEAIIEVVDNISGLSASCRVTVKAATPLNSGSSFVIENQEIRKGRVTNIPVLMNNDISVVSFNCDITLPEGLTLAKDQYSDYEITLSERCDNTHSISASDLNGKIRVVEYSSKNHAITGNEGTLFYLPVEIADDVEPGTELSIGISDIYLTEQESFKEVSCQDITASLTVLPAYTPGDINNDGKYSAADVSLAVEYALGRTPANGVAEAADVNNDGKVSAADISIIVSYVLSGKVANSQNAPARRMLAAASVAKCAFTAEDITGEKGATVELPVSLDFGDLEAVSFQCDIYLPEGVSVATDAYGEPYAELLSDRIVDHTINVAKQADGAYRFLSFSNKNRTYLGKDGVMFKVPLVLDAEAGNYSIGIKAATVTESETFTEFESAESSVELSITEAESVVEPEDFQFYTNKLVIAEGETEATLEFSFKSSEEVSGFAFDVVLPEGMTPVLDSEGYAEIEYGDRIPSRFDVDGEEIDGVFHIEGATTRNTSVESGDDVLFTLKLSVSAAPRFYGLNITNQTATLADGTETSVGDYTSIIKIQGTENVNLYIPNGGWATLCLPFAAEVPAGMKVYKAVGIENSAVVLEEQGKITANTPVIVSGAEGNYSFAENNKAANRINYKDGLLTGTLLDMKFSEGYVLQQQSNGFGFYRLTSAKTLPSYRCVLNNTQAVGAPTYMPIKFEDATRVDGLFKGEVDNVIYTLDGKKVDSMLKNNVYIINGNKVLIK